MFNFASKMLNTIMGTEEQQGQQGPGQGPYGGMSAPGQPRPMSGFPQVRPSPPQPGGQRPYGPSPPSFTGPRPSPGLARSAPPNFGGMARPMGAPGPGTPHRFNQGPPPQQQSMQGMMPPRGMMPPGSQLGPRGPGPPGQMQPLSPMPMRQRGPQPRQSFQQKVQPQLQLAGGGGSTGVPGAPAPDLDLSHLSAEERAMIENVMAKAQQLEQDAPPAPVPQSSSLGQPGPSRMMRPEDQRASGYEGDFGGGRLCPLCRQRDLSGRDGHLAQECAECGTLVCNRCGGLATHPETKRPEFTCGNCIKRRRAGVNAPGQPTQGGVRQMGPSPFSQQQPSNMEWENGRRGSGGSTGGMAGRAQQRWENDRESDSIEVERKAFKSWEAEEVEKDDLSSETSLSPRAWTEAAEGEPVHPNLPLDLGSVSPLNPSTSFSPDHTLSMSTPVSASASKAKPSFVNLHSRSVSLDMTEDDGARALHDNGFDMSSPPLPSSAVPVPAEPTKANALMEELSKLQSAVESYNLKRRERETKEPLETEASDPYLRRLSPSPSPQESPVESLSPLASPPIQRPRPLSPEKEFSPESPELEFPEPRKAIVLRDDLEDYRSSTDEESESDSEDERKGGAEGEVVSFFDHSPGEVYTIPEEEDEGGSPTGADLVTSLNRPGIQGSMGDCGIPRRRMGGESGSGLGGGTMPLDQRQGIRPQLRPQRSLDNRLPSMSNQPQPDMNQMDRQGNISYSNNNVNNTQLQNQMANAEVQEMIAQTSIASLTAQHPPSQQPPGAMGPMSSSLNTQPYQEQQQPTYSSMVGPEQHQQMEIGPAGLQRPTHQAQQHMQKTVDNLSEWNNNMNAGDHSGAGHMGMSNLDPNMPVSSQQSFQQQQLASNIYGQAQPQFQMGQLQQPDLQPHQQDPQLNHQHLLGQPQQPLQQPFQTQQQQQQNFQNQQFPPQQTTQPVQQSPQQFQTPQSQFQAQPLTQTQTTAPTQFQTQQQQQLHQQQLQAQQLHEQQLQAQQLQQQMQPPSSQQQQQLGSIPCGVQGASSAYSNQQWSQQQQPQQPPLFDQSGRSISSPSTSQFPQAPQYQGLQAQQQSTPHSMAQQHFTGQQHLNIITTQAGPAGPNKSISGLLADFSRALGLGASPRPSPSDEKSEMFLHSTEQQHGQMLSPYEQYLQQQQQQHPPGGAMQQMTHPPLHGSQQQILPSAFASIQDPNQMYVQQQQKQTQQQIHQQQYPYSQQSQMSMQQNVQPSLQQVGNPAQSYAAAQQQFLQANIPNHQQTQVMTQAGIMTQQQAASLGVGVVGALSPAQANMYQQQMALQHQAQHMKKSRRAHLTGSAGELRRDGSSTVYIGGQGLQVSPGGMTIGALTPAVVTSLGTFIGGGPTLIGTSLLQQQLSDPVGTPRSGRDAGDSSDTMSETDSQKSLRMRRKLPCLPPDQEAAPLPSTKKRERQRAQETFSRSLSPMRMSSFDTNMSRTYPMSNFGLSRPSASESNLRKISGMGISDQIPRPGSALGLLQGSSVVSNLASKSDTVYPLSGSMFSTSSLFPGMRLRAGNTGFPTGTDMTTTTSVLSGLYPSYKASDEWTSNLAELAACLPPDLRHLLNKGDTDLSSLGMSGMSNLTSGLGETNLNVGSHLPTYMRTLREQLQEERRQLLSDERRRLEALRERDRELGARLDAVTSRAGSERSRNVGMSRSAGASPVISRKVKGHRRQLSDPKLSLPFSPIQEDGDHELQDFDRGAAGVLRGSQYKSLEYESLEDSDLLRPVSGVGEFGWDPSQSYLASSWAAAGGVLRETAINSMGMVSDEDELRYRSSSRFMPRRSSEGEAWSLLSSSRTQSLTRDKRHQVRKHRKSRSWHPSPYVSEEEEEEEEENINREEKKARIKAEIARRRQQIQERAGIHQELMRMSRVRDGTEHDQHSVLKSVDQLIRDQYGQRQFDPHAVANSRHAMLFGRDKYGPGGSVSSGVISPCASEEDRSIERIASTFRNDDYTNLLYDRLGEMSPLATDSESMGSEMASTPAAMPILPDMPTTYRDRSRRLLEDIGRTDGAHHHHHHHHQRHREGPGSNLKGKATDVGGKGTGPRRESGASSEQFADEFSDDAGRDVVSLSRRKPKSRSSSNQVTTGVSDCGREDMSLSLGRKSQASHVPQDQVQASEDVYPFPVKKFTLTRDPNDRSVGGNGFGLRVVGGKEIPLSGGLIYAYVAKIYPTFSDTLGDIHEGDAVLEWNGISLDNKTFEDVQSIVASSEGEIEVVIRSNFNTHTGKSRLPGKMELNGYDSSKNSGSNINIMGEMSSITSPENIREETVSNKGKDQDSAFFQTCAMTSDIIKTIAAIGGSGDNKLSGDRRFSDQIKSPSSTEATSTGTSSVRHSVVAEGSVSELSTFRSLFQPRKSLETETETSPPLDEMRSLKPGPDGQNSFFQLIKCGQIQLQICHDPKANILYITILKAKLQKPPDKDRAASNQVQVDPYVVVYLLPERILDNKRRTRHVPMSYSPVWNQTMVYPNIAATDLGDKLLEVSAWNHNPNGEDTLFGKVTLQLSESGILDEQPHLYWLKREESGVGGKSKTKSRYSRCRISLGKSKRGSQSSWEG